jgi:DNA-directed RNA polymerase I, II, and III subunit RPABC2
MSSANQVPLKNQKNDDSENEDVELGLPEDIAASDDDASEITENDESGSQNTNDDDTDAETDTDVDLDENEGGDSGGEDEDAAAGGGAEGGGNDSEDDGGGGGAAKQKKNKKKRASSKKDAEDDLTLLGVPHGIHFDDDNPDEDEDDEDADRDSSEYFQKLTSSVSESYIETYHPESMSHNYDEIQTLSRVVRNSAGVIVDDLHRTIPIMTKYEKTRILGQRAKQLNEGAPAFIKIDSTVIDGYLIAVKELEQKKTPFIIRRPLPNGGSEYWRIQDLEIL